MLTVDDFITKFSKYSDQELFEMLQTIEGYSNEAKKALDHVIEERGGLGKLTSAIERSEKIAAETKRVQKEIYELSTGGFDKEFISKAVSSDILSGDSLHDLINDHYDYSVKDIQDKKVDSQTIGRCLVGGIVATLVSGTAFGALLIYTRAIHFLIIVGVALLCYGIIKVIARKPKFNTAVFVTIIVSTILAIVLGKLLFDFWGDGL